MRDSTMIFSIAVYFNEKALISWERTLYYRNWLKKWIFSPDWQTLKQTNHPQHYLLKTNTTHATWEHLRCHCSSDKCRLCLLELKTTRLKIKNKELQKRKQVVSLLTQNPGRRHGKQKKIKPLLLLLWTCVLCTYCSSSICGSTLLHWFL